MFVRPGASIYLGIFAYIHYLRPHIQFRSSWHSFCILVYVLFCWSIPCAYPHQWATLVTRNFLPTANLHFFYLETLVILRSVLNRISPPALLFLGHCLFVAANSVVAMLTILCLTNMWAHPYLHTYTYTFTHLGIYLESCLKL